MPSLLVRASDISTPPMSTSQASERTFALFVLVGAMVLSAVALLLIGRDTTIRGDNLEYATRLATQGLGHSLLHTPPNKYLIAVPLVVYRVMFSVFGLDNYFPYRVVVVVLVLVCAALFFTLARRRVGYVLALIPTVMLLFFGSGWEVVLTAIRLPALIAIASGLGALLALERRELVWDVVATVLLCIAVASHPTGVAFTAAAAVMVLLSPMPRRWQSAWVFLIPAAIFAIWYFVWRTTTPALIPNTASDVFLFVRQSWVMLTATVTGLSGVLPIPVYRQPIAEIAGALLFAVLVVVTAVRWRRLPPIYWATLLGLLVLLVSTRLSAGGFLRRPDEVRYLYPETILFLLIFAGLAASAKLPRWLQGAVGLVLALGVASNVPMLINGGDLSRSRSEVSTGQLTAYRIAGNQVNPNYAPSPLDTTAGLDLAAMARFGSAALTSPELLQASPLTRASADRALVGSLGIRPQRTSRQPVRTGAAPHVVASTAGSATPHGGCVELSPSRGANQAPGSAGLISVTLSLPPAGAQVSSADLSHVHLFLGRFAVPTVALPATKGRSAILRTPLGQSSVPWKLRVAADRPASVCGLAGQS
jgi:hypothetical protein